MVVYQSTFVLIIALAVFAVWRALVWRRQPGDPVREVAIWLLFVWVLAVVHITFFPMVIIFYDWASGLNLIPFASIRQLLTQAIPQVAFRNIVGNLILFVPFGLALPMLFGNVRSLGGVAWRAAVTSAAIEVLQWVTGARATDVDDIILNTVGAMVGYGLYRLLGGALSRSTSGRRLLDRLRTDPGREPLTLSLVPVGVTLFIVAPLLVLPIFAKTSGNGEDGVLADARAQLEGSEVLARVDFAQHTFIAVGNGDGTRLVGFERVLPGRFTLVSSSELIEAGGSRYDWTVTPFNVERDELPYLVVWGRNESGATSVEVAGFGESRRWPIGDGPFIVWAQADPEAMGEPQFTFRAEDGTDLSDEFQGP